MKHTSDRGLARLLCQTIEDGHMILAEGSRRYPLKFLKQWSHLVAQIRGKQVSKSFLGIQNKRSG